ncbi:hypothetical protein D0T49_01040 [Paludibacter sp. 221]|uniref:carbohydrate-binding family 9-like protein n=1 Tax=Paludibacter sp. 221 TaxID=2302939 RepID=UPI0013D5D062|nr:carbohydrate-binding family 9-like protein [Paludibacter sp. 221]NDV45635.1 hypothetical protein [Paludibacter sp. 221]
MKQVEIPYIPSLDSVSIEGGVGEVLDNEGKREAVDILNWPKLFSYRPITTFSVAYSQTALYIKFNVHGSMLRAIYTEDQEPVYEDSCVEFFCMKPGDDYYMNFEFNCIGTCLATRRKGRDADVRPLSAEEMQLIKRHSSLGRRAFKEMEGMFTWDLVVKIPFSLLGVEEGNMSDYFMGNFYKCADGTESPHYLSWSPINTESPDFHRPEFFGKLILKK